MKIQQMIEPAADWVGGNWINRLNQSASFLFMHGFINEVQRARITHKLERQLQDALEQGLIVQRAPVAPTPATTPTQAEPDDGPPCPAP